MITTGAIMMITASFFMGCLAYVYSHRCKRTWLMLSRTAIEEGYIIRFRLRCFFGFHKWEEMPKGKYIIQHEGWWCRRCEFIAPKCDNCGDRHNPAKITLCIHETRRGSE